MKRLSLAVLLAMIVVGALQFPLRVWVFALPVVPIARLWFDADAQHRVALAPVPYELLRAADAALSQPARVVLVTDGGDVRHREYTTFHRALYYLAPRAIVWLSPAPKDGTWEAKWWTSAPLTTESMMNVAHAHKADAILFVAPIPSGLQGQWIGIWKEGALLRINPSAQATLEPRLESRGMEGVGGVLVALALILSVGASAVGWIARTGYFFRRGEALMLAWVVGTGIVSLLLWLGLVAGLSLQTAVFLLFIPSTIGFVWSVRLFDVPRTFKSARHVKMLPRPTWRWLAGVWLGLDTLFVAWIAMAQPLVYWDSWVTWGMKARAIFVTQELSPAVYADATRAVTHLDYPLLLPLVETLMFQMLGAPDDRWIGSIAVGYFLALLAGVFYGARRLGASETRAWLGTLAVALMPGVALSAGAMVADVPLTAYAVLAAVALVKWMERGETGALWVAMLCLAFLPWLKREGWILAGALLFASALLAPRRARIWRGIVLCAVGALLIGGAWYIFVAAHKIPNTDFLALNVETLRANLDRAPRIALYFAREAVSAQSSFVFPVAVVILLAQWRYSSSRRAKIFQPRALFLLAPFLYVVTLASTYIFSAFIPYNAHLASSGYRLLAQVAPLVVLWIATFDQSNSWHV